MRNRRRLPLCLALVWLYVAAACALPTWLQWRSVRAPQAVDPATVLERWRAEYAAEQQERLHALTYQQAEQAALEAPPSHAASAELECSAEQHAQAETSHAVEHEAPQEERKASQEEHEAPHEEREAPQEEREAPQEEREAPLETAANAVSAFAAFDTRRTSFEAKRKPALHPLVANLTSPCAPCRDTRTATHDSKAILVGERFCGQNAISCKARSSADCFLALSQASSLQQFSERSCPPLDA